MTIDLVMVQAEIRTSDDELVTDAASALEAAQKSLPVVEGVERTVEAVDAPGGIWLVGLTPAEYKDLEDEGSHEFGCPETDSFWGYSIWMEMP
jgi:hypothetical protein